MSLPEAYISLRFNVLRSFNESEKAIISSVLSTIRSKSNVLECLPVDSAYKILATFLDESIKQLFPESRNYEIHELMKKYFLLTSLINETFIINRIL